MTGRKIESTILSITSTEPGWAVKVEITEEYEGESPTRETRVFPIVAWALVRRGYTNSLVTDDAVEPVFIETGAPVHSSRYWDLESIPNPGPGEEKVTVRITAFRPADDETVTEETR